MKSPPVFREPGSPRTEFNAFLGGARNWPVTEKGKAAMAIVDPKATTQKDCIP